MSPPTATEPCSVCEGHREVTFTVSPRGGGGPCDCTYTPWGCRHERTGPCDHCGATGVEPCPDCGARSDQLHGAECELAGAGVIR